MCGIVGYISKHPRGHEKSRERFMIEGLVMDTLRGWDSTGIIWVDNDFDVGTMRNTQPGPQFVRNKKFIETDTNGWACIGHNRAATRGSVKVGNAHPFRFGPIALVHNGTLTGWKTGMPAQNDKIEVDSAMVAYNLSLVEPDEVDKVLSTVQGDFAFVWTDARDESINFVRNNGRPLHLAESQNKNMMYFMSEAGMLRSLSERMRDNYAKIANIYSLGTYKHLKFKKGSLVPEVRAITPFVRKVYSGGGSHAARRNRKLDAEWTAAMRSTNGKAPNAAAKSSDTSSSTECGDNVLPFCTNDKAWRGGERRKLDPIAQEILHNVYQLNSSHRVSFVPDCYIPWDEERGMVRGLFSHPGWGDSPWEAVVYDFPKAWMNKERFQSEWTTQPIGVAPSWLGRDTMPAVMLSVKDFDWEPIDDDIPFEEPDEVAEKEGIKADPDNYIGTELFYGPDKKLLFREQLQSLLQYGCCYCQNNLTEDDHEDIEWVGMQGDQPLCVDCQEIFTDPDELHGYVGDDQEVYH